MKRSPRNRTLTLSRADRKRLNARLSKLDPPYRQAPEGVLLADCMKAIDSLPRNCVDLLFLDPPYNMTKSFNGKRFAKKSVDAYTAWLDEIVRSFLPLLRRTSSVYICGDWLTSHSVYEVASKYFKVRNRITWEREKGRGAQTNWKNASEDIWFCTVSDNDYVFNVDAVKTRRRVLAPYSNPDGSAKDWNRTEGTRDTYPSNIWTDITVPFWSMPENTDHPTQKSEKLLARIILASTDPGDFILDPFGGSGTTGVVAKKLGRRCLCIEEDREYALLALRRLELAALQPKIQGYDAGVFLDRGMRKA